MASLPELGAAAARDRTGPLAAPAGAGLPDRLRRMVADLLQRRPAHRGRLASSGAALSSARSLAEQIFSSQGTREELKRLKDQLRDVESQLARALSARSRNEAKHNLATESIASTTATAERLNNLVTDLRNKRDKHTAVISEELQALEAFEAKGNEAVTWQKTIEEGLSWYDECLGLKLVVRREGVHFVFDQIDPLCQEKEYSFCLKLAKDRYNLIQCDPYIEGIEELVNDLNYSNDLPKFIKITREKFQSSATNVNPVVVPVASSAPSLPPVTTPVNDRSEDVPNQSHSQSENKKQLRPAKRKGTAVSAASPGSFRRSPRIGGMR